MVRNQLGSLGFCVVLFGCGGEKKEEDTSIARALSHVTEGQEKAKVLADEKAFDKLKEKAAKEAADARKAQLDKLLAMPADTAQVDLEAACAQVVEGYDAYKRVRLQGDEAALARWDAIKGRDLEDLEKGCRDNGNVKVTMCKANAMRTAPLTFGVDDAERILLACEERYGNEVARVGN